MKYKKIGFRVILLFDRIEGIKIAGENNILIIFIKLINLIVFRQAYYLTHIRIIGFLNRRILKRE